MKLTILHPLPEGINLLLGKTPFAHKIPIPWRRQPGRHEANSGDGNHLMGMAAGILVSEQIEWAGIARTVTDSAVFEKNRGNVVIEGYMARAGCGQNRWLVRRTKRPA
ncbi:MAG: hypothetical protein ACRD3T_11125 [Terriglobia bacterium]